MPDRNHKLIHEIITVLGCSPARETILTQQFRDRLILDAGNVDDIARFAEQLRLRVTKTECSRVLDHIASKAMVGITIEHVDEAINALFNNRFIEPKN